MKQSFCQVLPRNTNYAASGATSIDLFVSELVRYSAAATTIVAQADGAPLDGDRFVELPVSPLAQSFRRMRVIAGEIRAHRYDAVIVQQHVPSALAINRAVSAPVILQRHNFVKGLKPSRLASGLLRPRKIRAFNKLAGILFVSETLLANFERDWPEITIPRAVIYNGIDPDRWQPQPFRRQDILVVGRAVPEKGILEAAQAIAVALKDAPDWTATFVLSEPARNSAYFSQIKAALAPLGDRARLLLDQPFSAVKAHCEASAIAVIASKWQEPFGRTCLEAHAGGAAVVSSGTGGLREISGEAALYVNPEQPASIAAALRELVGHADLRQATATSGRARVCEKFDLHLISTKFDGFCAAAGEQYYRRPG